MSLKVGPISKYIHPATSVSAVVFDPFPETREKVTEGHFSPLEKHVHSLAKGNS